MQVVRAIYDEQGIRAIEPIKVKRQTEVLVIFPDEVEKPSTVEARKLLRGSGRGEKLTEKLLKYRADDNAHDSRQK